MRILVNWTVLYSPSVLLFNCPPQVWTHINVLRCAATGEIACLTAACWENNSGNDTKEKSQEQSRTNSLCK